MFLVLATVCAAYVGVVIFVRRSTRARLARLAEMVGLPALPADDLPPPGAVGWPPDGAGLTAYVDEGIAAIDAYLSEGSAP